MFYLFKDVFSSNNFSSFDDVIDQKPIKTTKMSNKVKQIADDVLLSFEKVKKKNFL